MLKYLLYQWNVNEKHLREVIKTSTEIKGYKYKDIVKLVIDEVLNRTDDTDMTKFKSYIPYKFDIDTLVELGDGDYQGTLLYVFTLSNCYPLEYEYFSTFCDYGSCSGCDTLLGISCYDTTGIPTDEQVNDYMMLCKDIICNIIRLYPDRGYQSLIEDFEIVTMDI